MAGAQRIMIVGQPGSGKSTLARRLGAILGLPVIHVDQLHWQPGWIERSDAETTRLCREAEAGERWVFEGGHSRTWPSRLARADMLVLLDCKLRTRLGRVISRVMTGRGQARPDMPDGCPERIRMLPGFVAYMWLTRRTGRTKVVELSARANPRCTIMHLRSDAEVEALVARIGAGR